MLPGRNRSPNRNRDQDADDDADDENVPQEARNATNNPTDTVCTHTHINWDRRHEGICLGFSRI